MCVKTICSTADEKTLQADLVALESWEKSWMMEFHPDKCANMRASRKREQSTPSYTLHGQTLSSVKLTRYLGITLQSNLEWDEHVSCITKKRNKTLGFLRRNLKIGNTQTKALAYTHEYASSVWDPSNTCDIEAIDRVQKRVARWAANRHRNTSSSGEILESLVFPYGRPKMKNSWRWSSLVDLSILFHHGSM